MGWALLVLLSALALLVAALIVVVATPVTARIRFEAEPRPHWRIAVGLLGGLAPLPAIDTRDRPQTEPARPTTPRKTPETRRRRRKAIGAASKAPRLATATPTLVGRLARRVTFEELTIDGAFGLPDPADTGHLYGLLSPLLFAVPRPPRAQVALRPDFERAGLWGEAEVALRVTPVALALPMIAFAWGVFGPR